MLTCNMLNPNRRSIYFPKRLVSSAFPVSSERLHSETPFETILIASLVLCITFPFTWLTPTILHKQTASTVFPTGLNPICNGDAPSGQPATSNPTSAPVSTSNPPPQTTEAPPSTSNPTPAPSDTQPSTSNPTPAPTSTQASTSNPTPAPTSAQTSTPTNAPSTQSPTSPPSTSSPTLTPTSQPTSAPRPPPAQSVNTPSPISQNPLPIPTTATVSPGAKRTFVIHNNCPQTIWIGIYWNADKAPVTLANTGQTTTGFELGSQVSSEKVNLCSCTCCYCRSCYNLVFLAHPPAQDKAFAHRFQGSDFVRVFTVPSS
jgi:hypothetical protein